MALESTNPGFSLPEDTPPRSKRKVNYNQDAVLCPSCKKRIRLNKNGHMRVHVSGKAHSERCVGSNLDLWDALSIQPKDTSQHTSSSRMVG